MKSSKFLIVAIAGLLAVPPLRAQHAGHASMPPAPSPAPAVKKSKEVAPAARAVQKRQVRAKATSTRKPRAPAKQPKQRSTPVVDHSKMDHGQMQGMDHGQTDHGQMQGMDHGQTDNSQMQGMDHGKMPVSDLPADAAPREPIPALTATDRTDAFPPVHSHHVHGTSVQNYSLLDRLEVSRSEGVTEQAWEAAGWIGGDVQRFWWRTEGHAQSGSVERASVEALYGRAVRPWWDVVVGLRQDLGEGADRSWLGVGVQGLAPYKFEVSATAYVGPRGRTALRASAEYDTLVTNRLILQWRLEGNAYGKEDPALRIGSGLSTLEAGARLRYEITRQFAPYIGVEHDRAFGRTADYRRASGHGAGDTKVLAGVRIWF